MPTHEFGIYSIAEKSHKQKPVMFTKSPSPPPPIQRLARSDISSPARPHASKAREAPGKTTEKTQYGWKDRMSTWQKNPIDGSKTTDIISQLGWKEKTCNGQKFPNKVNEPIEISGLKEKISSGQKLPSKASEPTENPQLGSKKKTNHGQQKGISRDIKETVPSRRGSGSGEPRVLRPSSRINSAGHQGKTNEPCVKNRSEDFHVPTFHTSQSPIAKTLDDARKILMRSTLFYDQRAINDQGAVLSHDQKRRHLDNAIVVKPQCSFRGPNAFNEFTVPGNITKLSSSTFSTALKGPPQPQQRRRLGRSPSPPIIRMMSEQSRATNTTPSVEVCKKRDSKTNLKEELSRLKLSAPRHGSIGAASLGARRDAPPDARQAPSVRSDERSLATQGDMLNSIKFQRRFRETITAGRYGDKFIDKPSTTVKDKQSRNISSRTSSIGSKPVTSEEHRFNNTREKPSPGTARGLIRSPRPSSPKGRRSPHPPFY